MTAAGPSETASARARRRVAIERAGFDGDSSLSERSANAHGRGWVAVPTCSSNNYMKKKPLLVGLAAVVVGVVALSTEREGQAAPPDVLPSIAGFNLANGAHTTQDSVLKSAVLEIPIRVIGAQNRAGTLHVKRGVSTIFNKPFDIPAGQTSVLTTVDGVGMDKSCHPATYDLEIVGSGFDQKQKATITAACTYTNTNTDPVARLSPFVKQQRGQHHVFAHDASVYFKDGPSNPMPLAPAMDVACHSQLVFSAGVTNSLAQPVKGISLVVTKDGVVKGTSSPLSLDAGKSSTAVVLLPFEGEAGSYVLSLSGPSDLAADALASFGYRTDIGRACSITAALVP